MPFSIGNLNPKPILGHVFFRPKRRMFAGDSLSSRSHSVFKHGPNHVIESTVRTEPMTSTFVPDSTSTRSEEHTSELQSRGHLVCRLLLEKKKKKITKLFDEQAHTVRISTHSTPQSI